MKWTRSKDKYDYTSDNGLYTVYNCWDRIYGDHWDLYKNSASERKPLFHAKTLKEAKLFAERDMNHQKSRFDDITPDML